MTRVEFLYDYASPFAYIADVTLDRRLPGVEVERRPVYIRGLEMFRSGVPYTATKAAYILRDIERVGAFHDVPLRVPSVFPLNGLCGLRGALVAAQMGKFEPYHSRLFRATWVEDANIGDRDVVLGLAEDAGLDRSELAERMTSEEIKRQLRRNTDEASRRGVFGVPAFFAGDELFWGQDRIEYVRRALTG